MVEPFYNYQFRLIIIGDSTVGKSSLLKYFTDGKFTEVSDPTVGVDFFARLITLSNDVKVKLIIWDTAGQERFRSITKSYYRNTVGVILAYDTTSRKSFEKIPIWMAEASKFIEPFKPVFLLMGCKSDMEDKREIEFDEAEYYASHLSVQVIETSAKFGSNVEKAFQLLTEDIYQKIQMGFYKTPHDSNWDGIKEMSTTTNILSTSSMNGRQRSTHGLLEAEASRTKCCF